MDYSREFIINIIKYTEHIESVKEKTTKPLIPNNFTSNDYDELEEGNTLRRKGFGGSRVPKNTNDIIELLCCITSDVDAALEQLEPEERMAIFLRFGPYQNMVTTEISALSEEGLNKMVKFLNGFNRNLYY